MVHEEIMEKKHLVETEESDMVLEVAQANCKEILMDEV